MALYSVIDPSRNSFSYVFVVLFFNNNNPSVLCLSRLFIPIPVTQHVIFLKFSIATS